MKQILVNSLTESVGNLWKKLQAQYAQQGLFYVSSPLSSTPLPLYQWIIDHADEFPNWDKVRFVLMDEMVEGETSPFRYISTDDHASYERFARHKLLDPLKEKTGNKIPVIKPELATIKDFTTEIDLLILALGIQGNYANVMPGTPLERGWHIAHLTHEFRQGHTKIGSQSFEGADFREYGMSLGPQQVLSAKHVAVIISGEKKRELTKQLKSYDTFDQKFPLSIIYHPTIRDKVQLYITQDVLE